MTENKNHLVNPELSDDMNAATAAFAALAAAMAAAIAKVVEVMRQIAEDQEKQEWWKNGGQCPEYVHRPDSPVWDSKNEPPSFDSAA
jgi:hypothetical protein